MKCIFAIPLLILCIFMVNRADAQPPVPEDLGTELEKLLDKSELPSLAAAAILDGKLVSSGAVGLRKRGDDTTVTVEDKYHLGSCTKAMTATLAAIFVEEGLVEWNTRPADVFKDVKVHKEYRDATLLQLLSNTAGCPGDVPPALWRKLFTSKKSPRDQRRQLVKGILSSAPEYQPGKGQAYSNAGFSIAGAMLETIADKPWEELMMEKLFKPLEMTSAGFRAPGTRNKLDQPWGHNPKPVPPGPHADNPAAIGPAGAVHCTITDWAKFAQFHLEAKPGEIIKKQATFDRLHKIHNKAGSYALGWIAVKVPGLGKILQHGGSNTMWYSLIWIVPEKNFAAVSITNSGQPGAQKTCDEAIAMMMKKHIF